MADSENTQDIKTILLVDDSRADRIACEAILLTAGYRVITAKDGKEALDIFLAQRRGIALVIVDYRIPKLSGPEVIAEIKAIDKGMPMILCSGFDSSDLKRMGVEQNDDFSILSKPFKVDELLKLLASKISSK